MEKISLKGMIESVIEDIANKASIDTFIFKVQLIGRELKNEKFTQWIKSETDGYSLDATLPEYRIFSTQIKADVLIEQPYRGMLTLSAHTMPISSLPKDIAAKMSKIYLRQSVISLEEMVSSDNEKEIAFSTSEYERLQLRKIYENSTIMRAYKTFNKSDINLVVYKFKSILLEMFCDFNDKLFNNEIDFDIMKNKKEIEKIVNQTINTSVYVADKSTANITDAMLIGGQGNNVQITNEPIKKLSDIVNEIEKLANEIDADRTDIADAIISIREELDNKMPRPKFLKTAFNSIKAIGTGVIANKITPYVNSAIEIINQI